MAVVDLTGYTWVGNNNVDAETGFSPDEQFDLEYTTNNNPWYQYITFNAGEENTITGDWEQFEPPYDIGTDTLFENGVWQNEAYKTIIITGGVDVTNAKLIAWLEANGTLTAPTPQVSYPNSFQDVSLTDNNGYITLTINGIDYNLEKGSSGYEVELYGTYGAGEYVYVQINDDPTWYYAQMAGAGGFVTSSTNIPNAYQKVGHYSMGIPNVSKIKIGTQGDASSMSGPLYRSSNSTGDFVGLLFTSTGGSAPAYATGEITMTQDSKIEFRGDD